MASLCCAPSEPCFSDTLFEQEATEITEQGNPPFSLLPPVQTRLGCGWGRWQQDTQSAYSAQSVATLNLPFRLRHCSGSGGRHGCEVQASRRIFFFAMRFLLQ